MTTFPAINAIEYTLKKTTVLHRIHSSIFGPATFNPGLGKQRFSPFSNNTGNYVPTIYAGTTLDCALCETVFNDHIWKMGLLTVPKVKFHDLQYSTIRSKSELKLASLFSPDLATYGTNRVAIIECNHATDFTPIKFCENIHRNNSNLHGMIWTSRANDAHQSYIFFGDRVSETDFEIIDPHGLWTKPSSRLKTIHLAKRLKVALV